MTPNDFSTFRLYIAGEAAPSARALAQAQALCSGPLAGRCSIEIVDVLRDPARALADGIALTPTLLRLSPLPVRRIVGTFPDATSLLQALEGSASPACAGQAAVTALIDTLHQTHRQLEALTAGQVDAVASADGVFLLHQAEVQWRQRVADRQMALLNALPAHVAVLDAQGVIVAVNEAWRRFGRDNGLRDANHCIGRNYLAVCGLPPGQGSAEAGAVDTGLRALLAGDQVHFSIEYPCDSPTEERWFMLLATPLDVDRLAGVVVMHIDVSARARAERALRDSKAMLDMAGRSAKVGGWTFDVAQRRLDWSDMVASLHDEAPGYVPTMETGLAAFAPEHRDAIQAAVERCATVGTPYDIEAEKISATGRRFWVRTIGEAVRDADGRIVRIQGALQDITERKRAVLQSQKLAQRLSNTLESITDAFFTVDKDWRLTHINREAERLWGRPRDTMLGRVLWEVYPEALGTDFERLYRRAMVGETGIRCEACYPPLKRWFGVDCHPLDDGLSVYFRDVTDARAARQQLKLLEASVAQLNDIVIIGEPDPTLPHGLCIVFVNDAFVSLTGYTRDEVIGRSPALLDGPLTDAAERARLHAAVAQQVPVHMELVTCTRDGRQYPVELDVTPVAAAGEGVTHFVMVIRDIGERRRNEEALRVLNAGLEDRVLLRTRELERARELAEQANRAKSSFLATMSHEIRTPMNGVVGMIELLEESRLRPDQLGMIRTVRESADALLAIVDDVLDFSKIEAGQFMIDNAPMDVAALTEGVCDALHRLAENQGVMLHLYTDPRLPVQMLGDAGRLRQVLINLVGNAIKFSGGQARPGVVSLRAQCVSDAAGGDTLTLVVTDNGVGMDIDTLARLFSPFTQADASTTRRFGGTGLGLSISQRLVTLMEGEIDVSSALDQGSTFTVRLPVREAGGSAAVEPRLAGLPCLVMGTHHRAADLADYLVHARAAVHIAHTLGEGLRWLQGVAPGRCVIVAEGLPEDTRSVLAVCRGVALVRPDVALSFVSIRSGRRGPADPPQDDRVDLDGDCLRRVAFLQAVARAARPGPTVAAPAASVRVDAATTPAGPPPAPRDGGALILVAEDNEVNQEVLLRQLAMLGYRADMTSDGEQALARWREGGHALLLTDLHMPAMDGYTLAAAIRAEEGEGARVPIIALTANALRDEELRCRQAGMDAYLTKPLRLAQLKQVIEAWLPAA